MDTAKQTACDINAILNANITIYGVNISELLVSQREHIATLNKRIANITEVNHSLAKRVTDAAQKVPEPAEEEDGDTNVDIDVNITVKGPLSDDDRRYLALVINALNDK